MATQPFLTVPNVHTKLWEGAGGGRGEGGKQRKEREWRESGRRRIITCQPDDLTSNERGYVTICKVLKYEREEEEDSTLKCCSMNSKYSVRGRGEV